MYTSVSARTFGGPPLGDWEDGKESQNPELLLFVCVFWSFDFSGFSVYLNCEEGCADWWLLTLARLARVLAEALRRAIQRRVTRTRTKARTDRTRAAVPNVSPVAMRRRHAKQIGFFFFCPQCDTDCCNHVSVLTSWKTDFNSGDVQTRKQKKPYTPANPPNDSPCWNVSPFSRNGNHILLQALFVSPCLPTWWLEVSVCCSGGGCVGQRRGSVQTCTPGFQGQTAGRSREKKGVVKTSAEGSIR